MFIHRYTKHFLHLQQIPLHPYTDSLLILHILFLINPIKLFQHLQPLLSLYYPLTYHLFQILIFCLVIVIKLKPCLEVAELLVEGDLLNQCN